MTDSTLSMPSPRAVDPASATHTRRGEAKPFDAILFASFGGPDGQDDVIPFLRNVTRGRGIPDERLEEVAGHYRALGGRSPITAQNETMIAALEQELAGRGIDLPIYFGNRNWAPYNDDAVRALHGDGHRHALGLVTSAFSSYSSCRQYREDFGMVLETGLAGEVSIDKVRVYFNHPGFLEPVVDGVEALWRVSWRKATTPIGSRCCSPPTPCRPRWPRPPVPRRPASRAPAAGTSSSTSRPAAG